MAGERRFGQFGMSAWPLAGLALLAASPALSASQSQGVKAVLACRQISDPAQQLACFQKASEGLVKEPPAAAPAPEPTAEATPTAPPRKRAFGAPPPRPPKGSKPSADDRAELTLLSFYDPGDGRLVFHFSDGSTWREVVSESVAGSLKAGQTVILEKEFLGSYALDLPHRSSVKIFRERGD